MHHTVAPIHLSSNPQWFEKLPDSAYIRQNQLINQGLVPFSSTTLWRMVKRGRFPQPLKISPQITAWRIRDIRDWLKDPSSFGGEK